MPGNRQQRFKRLTTRYDSTGSRLSCRMKRPPLGKTWTTLVLWTHPQGNWLCFLMSCVCWFALIEFLRFPMNISFLESLSMSTSTLRNRLAVHILSLSSFRNAIALHFQPSSANTVASQSTECLRPTQNVMLCWFAWFQMGV